MKTIIVDGKKCGHTAQGSSYLRFAVDEVVPGTITLETKPTGRDSLDAVMAERKSRKCSSVI